MKNLLSYFLTAIFICAMLGVFSYFQMPPNISIDPEWHGPANPGWDAQYFRMKKNNDGIIPRGVFERIYKTESNKTGQAGNLTSGIEIGPESVGGRTRAFIIDINDPSKYFAGGISGGVWVSTNKGVNWTPINDQQLSLSVTHLAQDPTSPNLIYFGTGETRGNSSNLPGSGVFRSTDGGSSFHQLANSTGAAFDQIWRVATDPSRDSVLYVATKNGGLIRSLDAGQNFQIVFNNFTNITDIEVFPNGNVIIGVRSGGIYTSPTGDSASYVKMTSGLPSGNFRRVELAYCDSFPNIVYAQFENGGSDDLRGIYKSNNFGTSWMELANPVDSIGARYSFPWYCFTLAVKPTDSNYVISGCVDEVFTTNGGTKWNFMPNTHVDHHVIKFEPDNPNNVILGNDGGLWRVNTFGATDLNNEYEVTQFYAGAYFPTGINALGGTQDNGSHKCKNGSPLFSNVYGADGGFAAVNQQDPNISFISTQNGRIRRANNSSNTFPSYNLALNELDANGNGTVDDGAWFINPYEINTEDGTQLYFITQKRVWRSLNGAMNWSPLTFVISFSGNSPYAIGISKSTNPTVYIGGEAAMFYRVDGAVTSLPGDEFNLSNTVPSSVTGDFIACIEVSPQDSSVLYVAMSNFSSNPRIWRVTNATTTPIWTSIQGDLPVELPVNWVESHPHKPDSFIVIGTDFGLYTTTDAGTSWHKESLLPNVAIHNIRLRDSDRKLFVFTHGRGLWTADLPNLESISPHINNLQKVKIYPVPFVDELNIQNDNNFEINARVFTIDGELINEVQVNSFSSSSFHLEAQAAGIYLLEVRSPDALLYKKIVKY